jgi:non-heme chloroperoxidase
LDDDAAITMLGWNMVVPPQIRGALFAREIDAGDVLASLTVPVLLSHGRDDAIVLPSMSEHVLERCGTAAVSWYDDIGHLPFWEAPDRFNRELAKLVDRVNP